MKYAFVAAMMLLLAPNSFAGDPADASGHRWPAEKAWQWYNHQPWGPVNGKTQTQYPWGSKAGDPDPEVWQHDLFRKDRTPYDLREIELFQRAIAPSQHETPGTKKENHP